MFEKIKAAFDPSLIEFMQALASGFAGAAMGIKIGGVGVGFKSILAYTFFTVIVAPVVLALILPYFDSRGVALFACAVISSFAYFIYIGLWAVVKVFSTQPIKTAERIKKIWSKK